MKRAFTLIELLIVIAVIAILAALLFPVLGGAKSKAQRANCANNLRQIDLGIRLYDDESSDRSPSLTNGAQVWFRYRIMLHDYLGLKGPPSPEDKIFACPADTFHYALQTNGSVKRVPERHCAQSNYLYASYEFNGANEFTNQMPLYPEITRLPGISGRKLTSIRNPSRTLLIADASAFGCYSWHEPKPVHMPDGFDMPFFNDAKNVVGFVDGHVSYTKIYYNSSPNSNGLYSFAFFYDPPAGYAYQWSGD